MAVEIEQQTLFDYGSLDNETRVFVQEKAQSIHSRLKRTAEDVIAIGQDLIEVKGRLDHGQFIPWIQSEFEMTRMTAHNFMRAADRFGDKCTKFLHLPISVLYELAAPSTPDIIVDMVESRQILPTIPAIREAKREYQQEISAPVHVATPVIPFTEEPDEEEEEEYEEVETRYDPENHHAYCKYCYETHDDWELGSDFGDQNVWVCQKCDHATHDDFMQIYHLEPVDDDEDTDGSDIENDGIPSVQPEIQPMPAYVPVEEPPMSVKSPTLTALQSSESNEWFTPAAYVDAARELMGGIDVDPASNALANEIVQAATYYDIDTNGLDKPWHGRVWLNPPYGRDIAGSNQDVWSKRLLDQYRAGITKEAILLVNANTEAKWFQPFYDYLICLTNHRIRFYTNDGTPNQPTQGNALIYLGNQQERFIHVFKKFGRIVKAVD